MWHSTGPSAKYTPISINIDHSKGRQNTKAPICKAIWLIISLFWLFPSFLSDLYWPVLAWRSLPILSYETNWEHAPGNLDGKLIKNTFVNNTLYGIEDLSTKVRNDDLWQHCYLSVSYTTLDRNQIPPCTGENNEFINQLSVCFDCSLRFSFVLTCPLECSLDSSTNIELWDQLGRSHGGLINNTLF